ncbi:TTC28 [Branchiostoma lanceolatum]|uniref:TTC28 protein n=1 Tax=Branchiostoma lanceolatum TaxID=7740 RepID=A0A8K0AF53_BRALA|nr:TTC28 [Branchiostoma lanceolatum]
MAQLSRLAQLYLRISDNLTEDDVRNLRSLLSFDKILVKAKVEKATPLEIFDMLVDNDAIGKGNLGFLVQVLRCLGKGKLANEAERLEQEHKMEEKERHDTTAKTQESSASEDAQRTIEEGECALTVTGDSASEDSEPADTEVKKIISVETPPGDSTTDYQQTEEAPDDQDVHCATSELASLHIRELVRLISEPMKTPGLGPDEADAPADCQDAKDRLKTLLEELDTPAVMADQERQFHLYYQIGDLYRAKLYNFQLGLVCEGMQDSEMTLEWHRKALDMSEGSADKRDQIIARMSVGVLQGKVNQTTSHLDTALQMAQQKGEQYGQMWVYIHMGDLQRETFNSPRTAIQYYDQALALARQLGDRRQEGVTNNRLGQAHYEMRDYEEALEWYQKHLKIGQEIGEGKEEINALIAMGNALRFLGKIEQAKSHLTTALQMAQQTENQHGQMSVYLSMGDLQREQLHSPRTSIHYYEQALSLARQLMNRVEEALAYERLGLAYFDMGEYEKALEWHKKHLDMSQDNGDSKQQIRAHTNLGSTYRLLGKQDQATSHTSTALQMAQQTGDLHGQMEVYIKTGNLHREQLHSPLTATQYYEKHLALAKQLGDRRQEALAYNCLGHVHYGIEEYVEALEWYHKALKIREDDGDRKTQVTQHTDIGNAYRELGKEDQATSHFNTALQIAQQTGDLHEQMRVYFCIGDLHKDQLHSPRTSIQYYEQALALARQFGDRRQEKSAYSRLGQAHFDNGEFETALEWAKKDLDLSREGGCKKEEITAHSNIGKAYIKLNNKVEATSHLNTALQMAQQTGDQHGQMEVSFCFGDLQEDQLDSPRDAIQHYEQALALARQLGDKHHEGVAYNKIGLAHYDMEEYQLALDWQQKTLKTCEEHGDKKQIIAAQTCVGKTYSKLGKEDQATSHFNTALQMAQQTGDQHGQMRVYCKMGDLQREQLHSPRTSIQYYEQYLALARQLGDRREEGLAYNRLGQAHYDMEEYKLALDWQQKPLKTFKEHGDKKQLIAAHVCVGKTYSKLAKVDEATSHFNTALQMAQQTEDKHEQITVYFSMGDMQKDRLHPPSTSIQYYEQALALAKQLGDKRQKGTAYNRLGMAHHGMREHEAALEWFQKYLKISQEHGNKKDQITAHACVGNAYRSLGKTDQATSHLNTALQIAQQTGDQHGQMEVYCKMGDMQMEQLHSPGTAIQHYEQYLALARQLGDRREEHGAYNRLGLAHDEMGEYKAAVELHQKALKVIQECGDKKGEIAVHTNVGNACKFLGEIDQATLHFNTALQMAQQTGDQHGEMRVYFYMGDMNLDQLHSPHTAIQYYEQALALARQLEDVHYQAVGYCRLGEAHHKMREHQVALEWFQKCLKMRQESGNIKEQITAHQNIAASYQALGKRDLARSHYQSAMAIAMETGNKQEQDAITESLSIL